jgi:hypothetical protein
MDTSKTVLRIAAGRRVIEAAKEWYRGKGNVEAPLAQAVRELLDLENSDVV